MGRPPHPTPEQLEELKTASRLTREDRGTLPVKGSTVELTLGLASHAVCLLTLTPAVSAGSAGG
jgi:hypothetical protein